MTDSGEQRKSFTGRARRHRNRWSVQLTDSLARWMITIGGVGTIVAVLLVFAFLLSVTLPLFWPSAHLQRELEVAAPWSESPWAFAVNEYRSLGWSLEPDGRLRVFRVDTGEPIGTRDFCDEGRITSASYNPIAGDLVLGMEDGSLRIGRVRFAALFKEPAEVPEEFRNLPDDKPRTFEEGLLERTPQGQLRIQTVDAELSPPLKLAAAALTRVDHVSGAGEEGATGRGPTIVAYAADGALHYATSKFNELTNQFKLDDKLELPRPMSRSPGAPLRVLIAGRGDTVYAVWDDGWVLPYDVRDLEKAAVLEPVDVLVGSESRVTACMLMLGRETLVFGDSQGKLAAWFPVRRIVPAVGNTTRNASSEQETNSPTAEPGKSADDASVQAPQASSLEVTRLELAHVLEAGPAAVTALGLSQRSRLLSAGFADGTVAVYHVTTERRIAQSKVAGEGPVLTASLSPKDDSLVAATQTQLTRFEFDPKHPEGTFSALFRPVWYEGYDRPSHVWQSSFAGVEPEMKLGLWPLVFGTLKATVYSMAFGVPIALLAAIYTSEFMSPRAKAKVKPTIEMMASLPSVVLGFLAALVFAPVVETAVPQILTSFVLVPVSLVVGSALWQLMPPSWAPYAAPLRFPAILFTGGVGVAGSIAAGSTVERVLFAGDILRWLDGQIGRGAPGWLLLALPLSALATTVACSLWVNPWLRQRCGDWPRGAFGLLNAGKCFAAILFAGLLAWGTSELASAAGFDPRGSFVSTYVQRNALVVGFVMGFAIIPIIYTIADDALSTVPQHLRSASLGAGATPWQTAVRVVIPTAMSGLFSAIMIGLGRAVGETMIVLMAGGNTPVTDWNLFNGFRTLSANIAVELPEAVRDSTHFRTLFLAALTLFLLTFLVNTAAELVRLRFRRRALQL
jgi:phosphate transport system permease protein